MSLTRQQVYDVYAGTNLSEEKKDAFINGRKVLNSGIANYILVAENISSAQDVIDNMISIDEYINSHPDIYFGCKSL